MEEQLISFETAKVLKEKGFHIYEGVKVIYTSENGNLPDINNVILKYTDDGWIFSNKKEYLKHTEVICWTNAVNCILYNHPCWLAPTQSLVTKWLREIHEIHINIIVWRTMDHCDEYSYTITKPAYIKPLYNRKYKGLDIMDTCKELGSFDTYEEALEVGIFEALQLIKI